jgi:hypothetical protein
VADTRAKALRDLGSIEQALSAMSGLLAPVRMSVQEKLEGLLAYEGWQQRRG